MGQALNQLLTLLHLEKLGDQIYQGMSEDLGLPQVFGGQIIAQALYAAQNTVSIERHVHSLHSYFLRPGDSKKPIEYQVNNLRDGNSFSARQIDAIQNEKVIFSMTASFQEPESGFEHHHKMPLVPTPDTLISETQIAQSLADKLPLALKNKFIHERALEIRPVVFHHPLKGKVDKPIRQIWIKANGSATEDNATHQALLAYASDYYFLPTALQPHGLGFLEPGVQIATINHTMWFHRTFSLNNWLLYNMESPSASGGRGFVRGEFYTEDGLLVASTAQEGVLRYHK